MRTKTLAVVGLLGVVTVAAFLLAVVAPGVSVQATGMHVLPVTSGGSTCRDMTNNLRADRDAWRAAYFNYMAGFVTGANFVSYSVPGRNSNVGFDVPRDHVVYPRGDEAVFASFEQYCTQNPAKNISEAAMRVYSQLLAAK